MKSKLLDILTCVLKILSDFKKGIITPKKEERKKKKLVEEILCVPVCQFARVTEVIFNCFIFILPQKENLQLNN